jgi:hypothetical protein
MTPHDAHGSCDDGSADSGTLDPLLLPDALITDRVEQVTVETEADLPKLPTETDLLLVTFN